MTTYSDIAAAAMFPVLEYAYIAAFVPKVRVTLLGAGVPLVSAGVPTFHPTIFIRTLNIADDLTLGSGGVGGTVIRTLVVA